MSTKTLKIITAAAFAALYFYAPAAQAEGDDTDEQFSEAVSDFGYAGGAAWQCADKGARKGIEQNAMTAYNGLIRLFGSDEAYFFATAFGAGTIDKIDSSKCAEFSKQFTDGMKKGGAQ